MNVSNLVPIVLLLFGGACSSPEQGRQPDPRPAPKPAESSDPMAAACESGTAKSCLVAADAAERDGDLDRAATFYAAACDLGETSGCALGGGTAAQSGDLARANELFEVGCSAGDGISCHGKGLVALGYFGGERSDDAAFAAFERGCEAGFADACGAMADLITAGQGDGADLERAAQLRQSACEAGHASSCTRLGLEALQADDEARAVALFEKGCENELPQADACGWYGWTSWSAAQAGGEREVEEAADARTKAVSFLDVSCESDSAIGCTFRAVVAARSGDDSRAGELMERACELDPEECAALRAQFDSSTGE